MPATDNETLVIESQDSIKSLEIKDGKARVGAYAIRFSGPEQKDLQGEYFTPETYFGARKGDGADVLFSHGQAPTKAFAEICDRVFSPVKATMDEVGIFIEHCLDLADEYEKAIADLCSAGKLKWSSGATSHMVKVTDQGEIKRWPIAEFSYTPTPAEPRLPAISPLKSVEMNPEIASMISKALPREAAKYSDDQSRDDHGRWDGGGGGGGDSGGGGGGGGEYQPAHGDRVMVGDNVHGAGQAGYVTEVSPSGQYSTVTFSDGTSASYHNSDLSDASNGPATEAERAGYDAYQQTPGADMTLEEYIADSREDEGMIHGRSVDIQRLRMTEADQAAKDAATQKTADDRVVARTKEISEMYAVGAQINDIEIARSFVNDGKSIDDLRKHVLENVLKAKPVQPDAANLGMSGKEVKSYSLLKALHSMATKGRLEGIELEAHQAAVKAYGREDIKGFLVPEDVTRGFSRRYTKAQNVTTATAGGFLVETDHGPMIEMLRNRPQVMAAGATSLGGLVGDLALPVHSSGATAYWVAETGALTDSQSVFGQKKLTPKRLGATIPYSTQFLAQSSIDAESFIRDDATRVLAIEKDRAALLGSGAAGEPLGIKNDPGINATVTYSDAAVWGDVVEHETGIAVDNADIGSMAFMLDAATVGKWKTALKVATYGGTGYLIDPGIPMSANGYPVYRTNQLSAAHYSFFGVWSQLILASWAGLEVIVDPYALKKSGQVEITFNELCDILVRQPLAFNVSTDSAAA